MIMKKHTLKPYIMLIPLFLLILTFFLTPIFDTFLLSLSEWNGLGKREFVGIDNYSKMFSSRDFLGTLKNTAIYTLVSVVGNIGMGLILALSIARRKSVNFYRVIFYIPVLLSATTISLLWSKIFEPYFGVLNSFLRTIGLDVLTRQWLGDPTTALGATLAVAIWKYCGFAMILLLAAMLSIPKEIYEAANLDGITPVKEALLITIPMIRSVLLTTIMLQIANTMKGFDIVWVLTKGGPGTATKLLTIDIYLQAFQNSRYGYGAARAVFLAIVIIIITQLFRYYFVRFDTPRTERN